MLISSMVLMTIVSSTVATVEPEAMLILTMHRGTAGSVSRIINEPMWPALFYLSDDFRAVSPIFEEMAVSGPYPIFLSDTVSAANDADFGEFVARLTDAKIELLREGTWTHSGWVLGAGGKPEPDLSGFVIDHINRVVTVNQASPGRDPNGDGKWTDWSVDGYYEFYGHPIPEPATLTLFLAGCAVVGAFRAHRARAATRNR